MQLVLPVNQQHAFSLQNFCSVSNQGLIAHIESAFERSTHSSVAITYVHGSGVCGKTHLLLAISAVAETLGFSQQYLDMLTLSAMPPDIIQGLTNIDILCIDNIHLISEHDEWQKQVFDLINQCLENEVQHLFISATKPVVECGFSLPDLRSRLTWGTSFALHELDEIHKEKTLMRHFDDRGIIIQPEAVSYIMKRAPRDMHALMGIVEQLDNASLQNQRKLTIPFIKQALAL